MGIIKQTVKLNGKSVLALIDSGAETSFILESLAKKLGMKKGKRVKVYLGDGTRRYGYEVVGLITIDKQRLPIKLVAVKNLGGDKLVIGADFLQLMDYIIDFKGDKIKIKKQKYNYKGYRL